MVGGKQRRIITEPVPASLRHWPQYQLGYWSYVQGYKPRVPWLAGRKARKLKARQQALNAPYKKLEFKP